MVLFGFWTFVAEGASIYADLLRVEKTIPASDLVALKKRSDVTLLGSLIRKVLRTEGDTWAPLSRRRGTIRLGPQHPDNYGMQDTVFDGFQWQHLGQPAVQSRSKFSILTFNLDDRHAWFARF
ncbi:hypothetical protein LTR56_026866 [Elasticomyces elasticus]|nr:hypothetical protein LTR56_026866 [Elasticomyces elasticus]KAK5735320.1 hypothetical protein LTS12_026493 [Elasticomyces elasticus]